MTNSEFCAECEKRTAKIGRPQRLETLTAVFLATLEDAPSDIALDLERCRDEIGSCIWERHLWDILKQRFSVLYVTFSKPDGTVTIEDEDSICVVSEPDARSGLLAAVDAVEEKK